jgi:anti-anti-sigma factor
VDFNIDVSDLSGATVVALAGELVELTAPTFDAAIDPLCGNARQVMVDLTRLKRIDGLGLSALVQAFRRLRQHDCFLIVVAPPPGVRKVMNASGVEDFMPICHTLDEAGALATLLRRHVEGVRVQTAQPAAPDPGA